MHENVFDSLESALPPNFKGGFRSLKPCEKSDFFPNLKNYPRFWKIFLKFLFYEFTIFVWFKSTPEFKGQLTSLETLEKLQNDVVC